MSFTLIAAALLLLVLLGLLWPAWRGGSASVDLPAWLASADDDLKQLEGGATDLAGYAARRRAAEAALREACATARRGHSVRRAAVAAAVVVVGGSAALYALLGHPDAPAVSAAVASADAAHAQGGLQLSELAARLAARLQANPDDLQGWQMLGRSYAALGRFDEAAKAYQRAVAGANPDAALLADYADTLAAAQGGFDATTEALVERALRIDPDEPKSLSLAGTIAYNKGDYALATRHWTRLASRMPENSPQRRDVEASLADARAAAAGSHAASAGANGAAVLSGVVRIDPRLVAGDAGPQTLFISVRKAGQTGGPPLAARRLSVISFPVAFALGDGDAMLPGTRLSQNGPFTVSARISRDGSATPKAGDPSGQLQGVPAGAGELQLVIDTATP